MGEVRPRMSQSVWTGLLTPLGEATGWRPPLANVTLQGGCHLSHRPFCRASMAHLLGRIRHIIGNHDAGTRQDRISYASHGN